MLFVANNYDVQFNANGMNNMEQFRCHFSPLPVCGTIKTKTTNKKNTTAAAAVAADITTTTRNQLQQQQQEVKQNDYESLQVLADYKHFLLNESIVNEEDNSYPNNVRNDISPSISWFKKHKRQQRHLKFLRSSLLNIDLRRHRLDRS